MDYDNERGISIYREMTEDDIWREAVVADVCETGREDVSVIWQRMKIWRLTM